MKTKPKPSLKSFVLLYLKSFHKKRNSHHFSIVSNIQDFHHLYQQDYFTQNYFCFPAIISLTRKLLSYILGIPPLDEGNLIFCCTGTTDPNFWQIKIIIVILILHKIFLFFYNLYFFQYIFLLDHNKTHKKTKVQCT